MIAAVHVGCLVYFYCRDAEQQCSAVDEEQRSTMNGTRTREVVSVRINEVSDRGLAGPAGRCEVGGTATETLRNTPVALMRGWRPVRVQLRAQARRETARWPRSARLDRQTLLNGSRKMRFRYSATYRDRLLQHSPTRRLGTVSTVSHRRAARSAGRLAAVAIVSRHPSSP